MASPPLSPNSPNSKPSLTANTISHNGEIVCSVDETNRIRLALGLRPLRPNKPEPTEKLEPIDEGGNSDEQKKNDQKKKHSRRLRSIAEQAQVETDEEDANIDWKQKLTPGEKTILVLDDKPVLSNGKSKTKNDKLVNPDEIKRERSADQKFRDKVHSQKYDGTDNAQFSNLNDNKRGALSLEPVVDMVDDDYQASKSTFRKRKRTKKGRKRPRLDEGNESSKLVTTGHIKAMREAADAQMNEQNSDDDDDVYRSLMRANRAASGRQMNNTIDNILNVINQANNMDEGEEKERLMEDAAHIVYDEMNQFLQKIPLSLDQKDNADKDVTMEDNEVKTEPKIVSEVKPINDVVKKEEEVALPEVKIPTGVVEEKEISGMTGVAGMLQKMRDMGQLQQKVQQHGRTKDERFDSEEERDDEGKDGFNVKLTYQDDYGHELTKKEAFRLLCHKFHGKKPGQNKREKRLKKMLENLKAYNMQEDDTPLASASALKEETRRLGSAHVVLSGPQALVNDKIEEKKDSISRHDTDEEQESGNLGSQILKKEEKVVFKIGLNTTGSMRRIRR